ncbi:hypothetical protein O9992_18960 [Vibrio lentus]|nr:hypothetical protein [Vibrio lentus]
MKAARTCLPKIELHRDRSWQTLVVSNDNENIIAIAADSHVESDLQMAIQRLKEKRFVISSSVHAQSFDPSSTTSKTASCSSYKDSITPVVCCDSLLSCWLSVTQGQQDRR